jgi:hypothetical protein
MRPLPRKALKGMKKMKTLIAALFLASIAAPAAMAMDGSLEMMVGAETLTLPTPDIDSFERRSGRCPSHGATVAREGSTCGGV